MMKRRAFLTSAVATAGAAAASRGLNISAGVPATLAEPEPPDWRDEVRAVIERAGLADYSLEELGRLGQLSMSLNDSGLGWTASVCHSTEWLAKRGIRTEADMPSPLAIAYEATRRSIEHWERLRDRRHYPQERADGEGCALCKSFYQPGACQRCPLAQYNGCGSCRNSPWCVAAEAHWSLCQQEEQEARGLGGRLGEERVKELVRRMDAMVARLQEVQHYLPQLMSTWDTPWDSVHYGSTVRTKLRAEEGVAV